MRFRLILTTLALCLFVVLAGALIVQAQTQSLAERNSLWENDAVIGLPEDDEADDDADDERDDCEPYPAPVPQTGQTGCWHTSPIPILCTGTGQDGEYQAGVSMVEPRFTDNGDGTVLDNLTGYIWLQDANCFELRNWHGALNVSNALETGTCGLTDGSVPGDWRLPNVRELHSLIDFARNLPALSPDHPFYGVESYDYWTSTSGANGPSLAWIVSLNRGHVSGAFKSFPYYVWPVRGPEYPPSP